MRQLLLFFCYLIISQAIRSDDTLSLDPASEQPEVLPKKTLSTPQKKHFPPSCDITVEHGICLYGGEKMIVPDANIEGVVARYTFDDASYLDSTIHQNHGYPSDLFPAGGPGRGGFGSSVLLSEGRWIKVLPSESLSALQDFTITFWLYIYPTTGTSDQLPLFGKGKKSEEITSSVFLQLEEDDLPPPPITTTPLTDEQGNTPSEPVTSSYAGSTTDTQTREKPNDKSEKTAEENGETQTKAKPTDNKPEDTGKDSANKPEETGKDSDNKPEETGKDSDKQEETGKDSLDFGLFFVPSTQALIVKSESSNPKISLTSRGRIRYGRWTHVTLVGTASRANSGGLYQLYINGVLDVVSKPISGGGGWGAPTAPLYLGTTLPSTLLSDSESSFLIDDVKIWSRPATWLEVAADSFPSLGSVETYYTKLGCDVAGCTCSQAILACKQSHSHGSTKLRYHLCYENELYSGAYQVSRTMGWTEWDTKIWVLDQKGGCVGADEEELRLALCCLA